MNILRRLFGILRRLLDTTKRSEPASQEELPFVLEDHTPEALRKTLNIFIFRKATWAEKREMLHNTPLLLTPEAVMMCQEMARDAQGQYVTLAQAWEFLATLLETAREHGIDSAIDEWERLTNDQVNINLLQQWSSTSTYRDERQFLQHHSELLTDALDVLLRGGLELTQQGETFTPQQRQEQVETGYQRLYLIRDIRSRINRLRASGIFSDDTSLSKQAILEGYINWKGGFMLDLPTWLETAVKKSQALRRKQAQLSQTAVARAQLWKKALKRAQREVLAPEIIAEIAQRVWDALDDAMANQPEMQEEALAYLRVSLQTYTEELYPYQWALLQNQLGATYHDRIRGDKADNLEQAIAVLTASLRVVDADALPFDWARTQKNLGQTYWNRIRGDKADNLEQAITYCSAALRFLSEDTLPFEWAHVQNALGAIYLLRIRGSVSDNLEQAITYFMTALRVYTEDAHPSEWANIQNNLGNAYWNRIQGDKAENVERAIDYCTAALRVQTESDSPLDWANTQNGLGSAYLYRIRENRADNLEQAITCFTAALRVYTEDTFPAQWALTQNNLGTAYRDRIRGDKANNLEQAIACLTAALRVYTEEAFPYEWAKAQYNLGAAYHDRIRGDKADSLEQAIACLTAALQVYTEEAFPFLWAIAQNGLGMTYMERIRGDKADSLEQAIAYLTATLRVYTEKAFPHEWARTQNNLGAVYLDRIKGDKANNLEQAIACLTAASRVYTEEAFPYEWARTQNNLGAVYSDRIEGDKANNLEQAIACLTAASRVYTEEAFPYEWARTQNNLGTVYSDRIKGDKADNLEWAITCYTVVLRVTEEALPLDWAKTQFNLGTAYSDRIKGNRADNLEQAIICFVAALQVYTEEALPLDHRMTALNCAEILSEQQRWDEAHSTYLSALRVENGLYDLTGGVKEQDAILIRGRDGAVRDAYTLVRLGRLGEAAVTLEQGQARGLAASRVLNAADPQRITDPNRRADYLTKRDAYLQSLRAVQQPEKQPLLSVDISSEPSIETRLLYVEENMRRLEHIQRLRQNRAAFYAAVEAIHAVGDPADLLDNHVTEMSLLATAQRGPAGHAVISLAATPWGGMALGAFSAHPDRHATAHFAVLDLPALTYSAVEQLLIHGLGTESSQIPGGFVLASDIFASQGNIFTILQNNWADLQRPIWDGITPLQEWERQDVSRREDALNAATFANMAGWLHKTCQQQSITSSLDAACQEVLQKPAFHSSVAESWRSLKKEQQARLQGAVKQIFLLREVENVLTALSRWVMRPLTAWLREEGVTSVTIVPGGYLAFFPILACDVENGKTFADVFTASVAPSFRSLVPHEHTHHARSGVAALGNPFPTHQSLRYGQAEALTIAHLGGDPERCRIQEKATKAWLLQCLQDAEVVDASCHGVAREDYLQSALYLADDTLSLAEALNEQVADLSGLRLLILSACQTAIPNVVGAENEGRSLAVGMLQAGAQAVIASLWPAHDRATYLLIVRFAQEWFPNRASEPPAAALARAQHWLRNVTEQELTYWQASEPFHSILTTMPDARLEEQRAAFPIDVAIRGDESSLIADEDGFSDDSTQGDVHRPTIDDDGSENVRNFFPRQAGKNPYNCPYAHPFYWAGFQVTGW